jgi:hypothetical protein
VSNILRISDQTDARQKHSGKKVAYQASKQTFLEFGHGKLKEPSCIPIKRVLSLLLVSQTIGSVDAKLHLFWQRGLVFCQALQVLKHHEHSRDKVKAKEAWLSNIWVNPLQPLEVVEEVPSKKASSKV